MAATSIQDIREFHDVVRLLEEHPEWRAELRRLILSDEILALPEQVTRMATQVAALAEAQHHTETQISALTTRMDGLVTAQTRTATQLAALTNVVQGLGDGVGALKGEVLELRYGVRGVPSVGRLLRRSQVLSLRSTICWMMRSNMGRCQRRSAIRLPRRISLSTGKTARPG
jgi:hypothetical protein